MWCLWIPGCCSILEISPMRGDLALAANGTGSIYDNDILVVQLLGPKNTREWLLLRLVPPALPFNPRQFVTPPSGRPTGCPAEPSPGDTQRMTSHRHQCWYAAPLPCLGHLLAPLAPRSPLAPSAYSRLFACIGLYPSGSSTRVEECLICVAREAFFRS